MGWRDYGGKHYESVFTRFFHSGYLPEKFGYDLRKSYLSALICSGQITRSDALIELENPPLSSDLLKRDREYVLKKLGIAEDEYINIIHGDNKTYLDYPNTDKLWRSLSFFVKWARDRVTRVG